MLEQFLNHLKQKNLCGKSDRVLVAVSGGVDSMVLLHLFLKAGIPVGVAHVNFGLRTEAAEEEELVRQTCLGLNVPFFVRHFDTRKFATDNKLSIQVAARNLRYHFFNELADSERYNWVATAHHANDNLETVLLNLVRGTGIDGLTGIPEKQGRVIRPLLFATRADILQWAGENDVQWKEDASNRDDHYDRNLLRNQVVPHLKELNPSLEKSFARTLERIQGARNIAQHVIGIFRNEAVHITNGSAIIDRSRLLISAYPAVLLWEVIKEWGFSYDQCVDMTAAAHTGKQFSSSTHQLTVDRNTFIVNPISPRVFNDIKIHEAEGIVHGAWTALHLQHAENVDFVLNKDAAVANIDRDKLAFPLVWRKWRDGDSFVPLGMKHPKKVSDFLIDGKVSRPQKDMVTVLESAGTIAWVVGYRIADPFKISDSTKRILIIREVSSGNDFK